METLLLDITPTNNLSVILYFTIKLVCARQTEREKVCVRVCEAWRGIVHRLVFIVAVRVTQLLTVGNNERTGR